MTLQEALHALALNAAELRTEANTTELVNLAARTEARNDSVATYMRDKQAELDEMRISTTSLREQSATLVSTNERLATENARLSTETTRLAAKLSEALARIQQLIDNPYEADTTPVDTPPVAA